MSQSQKKQKYQGFAYALIAATLWGVSGALAQFLFTQDNFTPSWLVTVRMFVSAILLLSFALITRNKDIFKIWKNKKDAISLILFSIFGMLTVQYTYFVTILHSNAATATVLQYTGPVFIAIYLALKLRQWPKAIELLAISLALLGTFLLVTHGQLNSLIISAKALTWGIASALALATYTLMPVKLLHKYDSLSVITWSMLLASIVMAVVFKPFPLEVSWSESTVFAVVFIVILGTLVPFYIFLTAIKLIGPQRASLLACAEPLSATFIAVCYFQVPFHTLDYIGSLCIIITILLLTKIKKKQLTD